MGPRIISSGVVLCLSLAVSTAIVQAEVKLETEDQKTYYALGMALAARLPSFNPTDPQLEAISAGVADALRGKEARVDMQQYVQKLDGFVQQLVSAAAEKEKVAGIAFIAEAAKETGAVKTASGMVYVELSPGSGAQPATTDTVKIHYHGMLRDGAVFDSSVERGEPAEFALNGVVPCFSEGVQKMKVGGKSKLICPPDLAYGDRGAPQIPPGSTLVFEVELLEIGGQATSEAGS